MPPEQDEDELLVRKEHPSQESEHEPLAMNWNSELNSVCATCMEILSNQTAAYGASINRWLRAPNLYIPAGWNRCFPPTRHHPPPYSQYAACYHKGHRCLETHLHLERVCFYRYEFSMTGGSKPVYYCTACMEDVEEEDRRKVATRFQTISDSMQRRRDQFVADGGVPFDDPTFLRHTAIACLVTDVRQIIFDFLASPYQNTTWLL